FFQLHDLSDRTQCLRQLGQGYAAYTNINDERLHFLENKLPEYTDYIQVHSKENNMKGFTHETVEALKFTSKSTSECVKYLLHDIGFYYVLARSFSSDAVEATFSTIRMRCESQDATDARTAHHAIK